MKKLLAVALLGLMLAGCSGVPLTSYGKLARLDPMTAEPRDLRVAVMTSDAVDLTPGKVDLVMSYLAEDGSLDESHSLVVRPDDTPAFSSRLTRDLEPGFAVDTFELSAANADTMRGFQQRVRNFKAGDGEGEGTLSVSVNGFCTTRDAAAEDLPFAVYLKTSPEDDFFPMLRGDLKELFADSGADASQIPRCGEDA
ncbi:MAG: hypothetical protein V2I57_11745 [Xanthomonadales bacterium]|nr:hypothetical protein [Xanthomonadales bacterium]